jgi:hypothetical protein
MRLGGNSTSGFRSYITASEDVIYSLKKQNLSVPVLPVYLRAFAKLKEFNLIAMLDRDAM